MDDGEIALLDGVRQRFVGRSGPLGDEVKKVVDPLEEPTYRCGYTGRRWSDK